MSLGRRNTWLCLFLGDGGSKNEQLNVLADHRAAAALDELRAAAKTTQFFATRLPRLYL
jgi:hypothetical protein